MSRSKIGGAALAGFLLLLAIPTGTLAAAHCWVSSAMLNFGARTAATRLLDGSGEVIVQCQNVTQDNRQYLLELTLDIPDDLKKKVSDGNSSLPMLLGFSQNEEAPVTRLSSLTRRYREKVSFTSQQKIMRQIPVYGRLFMSREKSGNFRGTIPLTVGIEAL